jgi:O-antigen/teichoic acid export membrane protein
VGEIKKQSINNFIYSYLGAALGFLTIYIQPNLMSSSDIGLLRLLYSFSWLAAMAMPFGIVSITSRFFPRIKNEKNGNNGFFAILLLATSIGAIIIAGVLYFNKHHFESYYQKSSEFPKYFNEAIIFAYLLSLISVFTVYSASLLKTTFTVFLTDVFVRLGQLILVIIYHYQLISKHSLVIGFIGVFFLQLILLVVYLKKINAISFKINWAFYLTLPLKQIFYFGVLMMFTGFASLSIKFIDQLMIGHFLNEKLVGIYATSIMMCAIMEIPFNSLERIAQPRISHAWNINDIDEVGKIYKMSSRYMFFIGSVLFCVLWSSIDFIFTFLPDEYLSGKYAFYLVSISSLINLLTGVNTSVIIMSHKYFATSFLLIMLFFVSLIFNYFFIQDYGITGAAIAMLIAIGFFNILKYIYILIRFKMQPFNIHTFYILISLIITILFIQLIPNSIHPFLKTLFGCGFTLILFSLVNIRFKIIEEINKIFKHLKLIK